MCESYFTESWDKATLETKRMHLYQSRLDYLRRHMAKNDVPALLLLDPNDVFYATGAANIQARFLLSQASPESARSIKRADHH